MPDRVPRDEQQRPGDGQHERVGHHQRDHRADAGVALVALREHDHQG
jgi:hypothetical protein